MESLAYIFGIFLIILLIYFIFRQIEEFNLQDDPMIFELKESVRPIIENLDINGKKGKDVFKRVKIYKGDKSYTINKEKIFLCLRNENGNYYNKNTLLYPLLHEYAHVYCNSVGHTDEFHEIFQQLIELASSKGIYNPSIPMDEKYCLY